MKKVQRKYTVMDTMCGAKIQVDLEARDPQRETTTEGKVSLSSKCRVCPAQNFCPKLLTMKSVLDLEGVSTGQKVVLLLDLLSSDTDIGSKQLTITSREVEVQGTW